MPWVSLMPGQAEEDMATFFWGKEMMSVWDFLGVLGFTSGSLKNPWVPYMAGIIIQKYTHPPKKWEPGRWSDSERGCQARTVLEVYQVRKLSPSFIGFVMGQPTPHPFSLSLPFIATSYHLYTLRDELFFHPKTSLFKKRASQLHCHLPIRFGGLRYNFWHPIKSWKI